jgi:glucose/arabinose dehydrogenase
MNENDTIEQAIIAGAVAAVLLIAVLVAVSAGTVLVAIGIASDSSAAASNAPAVITRDTPPDPTQYVWREIVSGLDNPLLVTHAGDDRLFAVEQGGYVLLIENGEINPQPFLDVSLLLSDDVLQGGYTERGLLGLAFDPDYAANGRVFVSYTNRQGHSTLDRYHAADDHVDESSRVELLLVEQPFDDHNGGHIVFGPDGYLYMGIGDGGNPDIPNTNGQDPQALLGKVLRLDVNGESYTVPDSNPFVDDATFRPEIWAMGVRNPWRFTFDRATGDLYIGDVGQWSWEELNFQPADSPGGENYGWSIFEGTHIYQEGWAPYSVMTEPIFEYPHQEGCAITGGYVYRGPSLPELQGVYIFGDYCTGIVRAAYRDVSGAWQVKEFGDTDFIISSFGEDVNGELYLVDYKGGIYRLEAS